MQKVASGQGPTGHHRQLQELKSLHSLFMAGNLRILVGAGLSMESGLPSWNELIHGLLERSMMRISRKKELPPHIASLIQVPIQEHMQELYDRLGRDAIPDLVRHLHKVDDLLSWMREILYGDLPIDNLQVRSIHRQLAAMSLNGKSKALLHTTNYDPLLELAIAKQLRGAEQVDRPSFGTEPWKQFVTPIPKTWSHSGDPGFDAPTVGHIHGFLGTGHDDIGGEIILAESHYIELQTDAESPANQNLLEMLNGELLIVGMSMSDPNLRRLLFLNHKNARAGDSRSSVYALIQAPEMEMQRWYLQEFWHARGVHALMYEEHHDLTHLLRMVQFGPDQEGTETWLELSRKWVEQRLKGISPFADGPRQKCFAAMQALKETLNGCFEIPSTEGIELSLLTLAGGGDFDPAPPAQTQPPGYLFELARSSDEIHLPTRSPHSCIPIPSPGSLETACVVGSSFLRGLPVDTVNVDEGLPYWRSVLAIPILGTVDWVPIAVVAVTSKSSRPFWTRFKETSTRDQSLLMSLVRTGAQKLLDLIAENASATQTPRSQ